MATHMVYLKPTPVLNGTVIDKETATIAEMMKSDTEIRVIPDATIPNSAGSPAIEDYLQLENTDGFLVVSLTNTAIVTAS